MTEQIALIEAPVYETTGAEGPRVLHDLVRFDIFNSPCLVRTSPDGDILFLRVGGRDFAISLLDLAATAAVAVEGHLKGEIRARILGERNPGRVSAGAPDAAAIPIRGVVEADGFITLHPRRD